MPYKVAEVVILNSERLKVLIIGYVWPEVQSSAAGLRDWNLIQTFLNAGWDLTYASPSQENSFSQKLQDRGIEVKTVRPNDPLFDEWIRTQNPDYVIFDRFVIEEQFGWRVQETCPEAVRVLDTQDLHFLRRLRESFLKQGKSISELAQCHFELVSDDTLRELAAIYRSDLTFILSDFEMALLKDKFQIPEDLISLSRFHYPEPELIPNFHERKNFMMIGNFRHPPNCDGILWFREHVWPLVHCELPQAQVHIYGAYPPKEMMSLSEKKIGFQVMGPTPDQFKTLKQYRVNLAPLRFGAGIKGKITDGWWAGTPVVTTPIGAEGMSEALPWGGEIAENPEDFAKKAIELYQNQDLWSLHQMSGLNLIRILYSEQNNSKCILDTFFKIKENLKTRRSSNLIGLMLNHHLHKSTKYFSKWIEQKNKA